MSFQQKMVDTATGASPPWTSTREMACSPVNFNLSIQMGTSDDFHDCSTTINHGKRNAEEIIVMNEVMNRQSIVPYPSPITTESSNSSPVLSSITSMKPRPLMSIGEDGIGEGYGIDSTTGSSSGINIINKENNNHRYWPVDRPNPYNIRNHQPRTRNNRRNRIHHRQHQCFHKQFVRRPHTASSVGCRHMKNHLNNDHRTYCTCYDCCL